MYRRTLGISLGIALVAGANLVHAGCIPILGTVQLTQDASCQVLNHYPPQTPFVGGDNCFQMSLKLGGILPATGYAGVTAEPGPVLVQGDRAVLTARSTFSLGGTRFYASEVIVQSGAVVTEQSVIAGNDGRGLMRNYKSGYFHILGNSIGQTAQVRGEVCTD